MTVHFALPSIKQMIIPRILKGNEKVYTKQISSIEQVYRFFTNCYVNIEQRNGNKIMGNFFHSTLLNTSAKIFHKKFRIL